MADNRILSCSGYWTDPFEFNVFNYIQTPNVQNNFNWNGQSPNLRNRETINYPKLQYTTNQNPLIQNQLTISNNVQQQNIFNSNQRNRGTVNYQTLQYSVNQNPLTQNQFTVSNNVQKQNLLNSGTIGDQYRIKQYNTNRRQNPKPALQGVTIVQGHVIEIGRPSSGNLATNQQYSTIKPPRRNIQERALNSQLSANIVTNQQYSNIPIPKRNTQGRSLTGTSTSTNFLTIQQQVTTQRNPKVTAFYTPSSVNFATTQQYSNIPLRNRNIQERSVGTSSSAKNQQFSSIQISNRKTPERATRTPPSANFATNQQFSTTQLPNRHSQGRAITAPTFANVITTQQYFNIPEPNRKTQGRAIGIPSSANFVQNQQFSNTQLLNRNGGQATANLNTPQEYSSSQQLPKRNIVNHDSAMFESRFGADDNFSSNQSTHPDVYQYQYSKGWSVHEALSVNDLVKPHLQYQKNLKYSTPYTPEAQYYQKFYNIYNDVENHGRQDLIQYEKESVNDDFNGRSIVAPGQYPHMAAIGFLSNEDKIEFKCGGSLISDLFVITAAHCCYLSGETPIIVKLGIINLKDQTGNSNPQRRAIKEIIVHPSYNSNTTYHDIALLQLQKPVEFTKFVRPILLWTSDHIPYERVFTMGYGSTSFAKAPTNILTELSLSLIPWQKCKQSLPPNEKTPHGITETQLCGRDLEKNRDTCQGDSGGPLQLNLEHRKHRNTYRYYLVGIISYGDFCGSKKPGVYTRVSSYCKWIASVVWPEYFESFKK
ncbi:uncharacterized protein LOC124419749 [Lucilia cuprina]|uniref:uncharacterized protein LOC124419749 n=1 Tax=Lucilia cuprina TaxID=7375 RepID=UPI001F06DF51|nr:uncharacterized protein LOC124419749 [Lucilia cuprina]